MGLRSPNTGCQPLRGASVETGHVGRQGLYSSDIPYHSCCSRGTTDVTAAQFGRGAQVADRKTGVFSHTTFPGWSRGRATHIHRRLRIGSRLSWTTQLVLDDIVDDQILAGQPV